MSARLIRSYRCYSSAQQHDRHCKLPPKWYGFRVAVDHSLQLPLAHIGEVLARGVMPKSEATTSDLKGIGNVIRDARLRVPKHQRPFEWTDVQVNELLEDVGNAFSEEQNEYFLGSIVAILPPKADWHEVLDGQQRLASISMFFAAASAEFTVRNEAARAADVSLNLSSFDMKSGKYLPRLRLAHRTMPTSRNS